MAVFLVLIVWPWLYLRARRWLRRNVQRSTTSWTGWVWSPRYQALHRSNSQAFLDGSSRPGSEVSDDEFDASALITLHNNRHSLAGHLDAKHSRRADHQAIMSTKTWHLFSDTEDRSQRLCRLRGNAEQTEACFLHRSHNPLPGEPVMDPHMANRWLGKLLMDLHTGEANSHRIPAVYDIAKCLQMAGYHAKDWALLDTHLSTISTWVHFTFNIHTDHFPYTLAELQLELGHAKTRCFGEVALPCLLSHLSRVESTLVLQYLCEGCLEPEPRPGAARVAPARAAAALPQLIEIEVVA